jgi:hypothetical protein
MASCFELFDLVSGNVFDVYERESDAIDALIEFARESGADEVGRFALTHVQDDDSSVIAMRDELVRRVEAETKRLISTPRT